jgi:hypothetical protein
VGEVLQVVRPSRCWQCWIVHKFSGLGYELDLRHFEICYSQLTFYNTGMNLDGDHFLYVTHLIR